MNLFLLAGNSKRNKDWIYSVGYALKVLFDAAKVHDYAHWESGEEFVDIEKELKTIIDETKTLLPYAIFAKSVGGVIAIKGINEKVLQPNTCIITGLPLSLIAKESLPVSEWLSETTVPITIIQNEHDPLGSYEDVREFVDKSGALTCTVVCAPGDTHSYEDLDLLKQLIGEAVTI